MWLIGFFLLFSIPSQSTYAQTKASTKFNIDTINLSIQAKKELESSAQKTMAQKKTSEIRPTPATVRARVEEVESPVSYTAIQMGLSYQNFQPQGQGEVVGQDNVSWSQLSKTALVALEFRWLPYQPMQIPLFFGSFLNFGYAEQGLNIETVTGERFRNAKLHSAKWGLGLTAEYYIPRLKRLSFATSIGFGELYGVQASSSAYTSSSHQLSYFSSGIFTQFNLAPHLKVFVGNDYRMPVRKENIDFKIQRSNWIVGFLGSFD